MAGRKHEAIGTIVAGCDIGYEGSRHGFRQQFNQNSIASKDLRSSVGGRIAEKTAVKANEDTIMLPILANNIIGQTLAKPTDVIQRKPFANECTPPARPEADDVCLLYTSDAADE